VQEVVTASEKARGAPVDMRRCLRFCTCIQSCGLIDSGSVVPKFTWRGQECRGYGRVFERLDRGLGNQILRLKFPDMYIKVLLQIINRTTSPY
jgi:hypothetical protein